MSDTGKLATFATAHNEDLHHVEKPKIKQSPPVERPAERPEKNSFECKTFFFSTEEDLRIRAYLCWLRLIKDIRVIGLWLAEACRATPLLIIAASASAGATAAASAAAAAEQKLVDVSRDVGGLEVVVVVGASSPSLPFPSAGGAWSPAHAAVTHAHIADRQRHTHRLSRLVVPGEAAEQRRTHRVRGRLLHPPIPLPSGQLPH